MISPSLYVTRHIAADAAAPSRLRARTGAYWRHAVLVAFNALLVAWLLAKPAPQSRFVTVANTAYWVGPLIAVLWCVPVFFRRKRDRVTEVTPPADGASAPHVRGASPPTCADATTSGNPARASAVCLALGVACFVVGQAIWAFYENVLGRQTPFPSWADAAFLAAYPFLFLGVFLMPARPLPAIARWRILLDSVTSMAALVTFSWYFILAPQIALGSETLLGKVLGPLYPLGDLALLFGVLLMTGGRAPKGTTRIAITLGLGLASIIVIDTAFAYQTLHRTYVTGRLVDVGWPVGYMLVGLAAWQLHARGAALAVARTDGRATGATGGRPPEGPSLLQSLLPYAFMPPAIALMCFVYGTGGWDLRAWGVYGGAAVLVLLVLARQFFVVCENEGLYRKLNAAYADLADHHRSLEEANRRLRSLATTDGMTDLPNHRAMQERLREELARSRRSGAPVSLLLLDVDHFKAFNDAFGHPAGDRVLKAVASALRTCVRESDLPARYGGEEFAVVIPGAAADDARAVAERVRAAIAAHPCEHRPVTASIGLACTNVAGAEPGDLIEAADRALYQSKSAGRNRVTVAAAYAGPTDRPPPHDDASRVPLAAV